MKKVIKNDVSFFVSDAKQFEFFWDNVFSNHWEDFTFNILDYYLHPDKNYLDIGAWIGPTVLYAANKAKHTFSIEPDPVAFAELQKNMEMNTSIAHKITLINKALSYQSGTKKLYKREHFGDSSSSLIPTLSDDFHTVSVSTLKEVLKEFLIEDLSLIKMDIEGGEYLLVPSMRSYLKKYKPAFYLSLHPNFLKSYMLKECSSEKEREKTFRKRVKKLVKSLKMYEYIYDSSFHRIDQNDFLDLLLTINEPVEFLFTSTPLNTTNK
ncbi:FkbM family methyltransferase [Fictibacillus nanhaiensis]|uniref:FkbM family methyltransferase n=1 Tax=Fictibacillus nanhaiensis TaxID=742169 RepID=UPI001C955389|nr:FkbM family methyltransferase [Fictibacillus nanhaiensis]MBY6037803.1 FkbM family methyltransferase [Fictibacillus nanhaiensis]